MVTRIIKNVSRKILVVGPIYGKIEKLSKLESMLPNYEYVIFNGNLYYPFMKLEKLQECINKIKSFNSQKIIYNLGNYDLMLTEGLLVPIPDEISNWYINQPNIIMCDFVNHNRIIITSGGITPQMNRDKLLDNLESSFVNKINGIPWHELYGGAFGYIISNNPLTMKYPKFYNYSAQIGTEPQSEIVYAQEADQFGLKETISL